MTKTSCQYSGLVAITLITVTHSYRVGCGFCDGNQVEVVEVDFHSEKISHEFRRVVDRLLNDALNLGSQSQ